MVQFNMVKPCLELVQNFNGADFSWIFLHNEDFALKVVAMTSLLMTSYPTSRKKL